MADLNWNKLQSYYSELNKYVENQNFSKIIKAANKIVAEFDCEVKAWQCKLTAQIHLGEFKEGLHSLKKCKILEKLAFEKSYCEYRLNKTEEAWETLKNIDSQNEPRTKELQAQILYRLERYNECFAIYRDLVKTTSDQFDQERLTNLAAVCVNRIYEGSKEKGPRAGTDASYERMYNYACELLAFGKVQEAYKCLINAETMCKNVLTQQEGASEDEVNEETAIMRVQQGHCLQLLGRDRDALSIYNGVLKTKPDDPAIVAIINNNIVTINKEGNLFDSKKRLKATTMQALTHKLTSRQRGSIALNHCLLAYYTNQDEAVYSECSKLDSSFAREKLAVAVIRAAQLAKSAKPEEASKSLRAFAEENPSSSLVALLSAAQILLSGNCLEGAVDILLSLQDKYKYSSGSLSALVVICSALKKMDQVSHIFKDAVDWHKQNKSPPSYLSELWRQTAKFHLRHGDPQLAAASLQELRKFDPSNQNTLAQLISAYSMFDTEKAQSLSKELPNPSSLVANLDADALENSFGLKYGRKGVIPGKDSSDTSSGLLRGGNTKIESPLGKDMQKRKQQQQKKKKKKRKPKLPKNMVAGEEPDPERWLPRWQRKGYKKKRDRRNKDALMKGTQGVSSDASDKFDITKMARQTKTHVSSPKTESGSKRTFQKKKGGKKKKG